jgi:hypothetical protein
MIESIYTKIDADSLGADADRIEEYAAFVRARLAAEYPEATIVIETTTRESGVMPFTVEPLEAEAEVRETMTRCWEDWCRG